MVCVNQEFMQTEHTEEGLRRVIGVPELTLSIVNSVIGAGIFVLPATISMELGAFGIVAYIFCSIMLMAIMLSYAKLGSIITKSGGSYAYVEAAFGSFPAYVVNWLYFFGWSVLGSAALMNIIADSLAIIFPVFSDFYFRGIFFAILAGFMIGINVKGAKQGISFIKVISVVKLLPLIFLIIFGFSQVKYTNLVWKTYPTMESFGKTSLILFFAFAGFETSLGVSGEFKNPERTVPLGMMIGGIILLIVYMLLQTVSQGILGTEIVNYQKAPLAEIANRLIGPAGGTLLLLTTAISCLGSITADIMATPRSLFAAANDGMFPKFLSKIHIKYATPYTAIILYGLMILLFSISGSFKQLAVLASAAILIIYLAVIMSFVKMKLQKPETKVNNFKTPGGFLIPIIGIVSIIALLSSLSRTEIIATFVFLIVIIILFFITRKLKNMKNQKC